MEINEKLPGRKSLKSIMPPATHNYLTSCQNNVHTYYTYILYKAVYKL